MITFTDDTNTVHNFDALGFKGSVKEHALDRGYHFGYLKRILANPESVTVQANTGRLIVKGYGMGFVVARHTRNEGVHALVIAVFKDDVANAA